MISTTNIIRVDINICYVSYRLAFYLSSLCILSTVQLKVFFFFFKDPATPEFYPLSLPDPLPISHPAVPGKPAGDVGPADRDQSLGRGAADPRGAAADGRRAGRQDRQHLERCRPRRQHGRDRRSEEHTSELQSPCNLVCRLLLEKK